MPDVSARESRRLASVAGQTVVHAEFRAQSEAPRFLPKALGVALASSAGDSPQPAPNQSCALPQTTPLPQSRARGSGSGSCRGGQAGERTFPPLCRALQIAEPKSGGEKQPAARAYLPALTPGCCSSELLAGPRPWHGAARLSPPRPPRLALERAGGAREWRHCAGRRSPAWSPPDAPLPPVPRRHSHFTNPPDWRDVGASGCLRTRSRSPSRLTLSKAALARSLAGALATCRLHPRAAGSNPRWVAGAGGGR